MSRRSHSATNSEPNLTPMLDLVFQLITFFMLVCNFKAQAVDLDLKLPVVGSARPIDTKGQEELIVLNINEKGQLKVYGQPVSNVPQFIAREAQATLISARQKQPDLQFGEQLPATVVIRADRGTPFAMLNEVIETCQKNGFLKFALKAMNKSE